MNTVSKFLAISLLSGLSGFMPSMTYAQDNTTWVVKKTTWSTQDEKNFQNFISSIGEAAASKKCRTTDSCLKSAANPYRNSDASNAQFYSDCADLPYYLRSYFAWKNQLPFTYAAETVPAGNSSRDLRYSPMGNVVKKRKAVFTGVKGNYILNNVVPNSISSAAFRMEYDANTGYEAPDFYSAKISRESVQPGTSIYDPNGHVAVVYKVSADGRVHYIDAHPDNSITSGIYSPKFVRSNPRHGAGFKNWRPFKIVNASTNSRGEIVNGSIVMAKNAEIPGYGIEQYWGTQVDRNSWKNGKFIQDGREVNYYDYVRFNLAEGNLQIDPVQDFKEILEDICVAVQDRVVAAQNAIDTKISVASHPSRLPRNIYGTDGEWETFSSPSRDARLKTSFVDLMDQTKSYFAKIANRDASIVYQGVDLKSDLREAYKAYAPTCQITYQKSNGTSVTLNLEQIRQRLFDLSFDPYHCIEARWGASGEELSSCRDNDNKRQWYAREKWIRNQIERTYDAKMDYSLDELTGPKPGAGVATPPDVDILKLLQ
jgi:hypothetical protein